MSSNGHGLGTADNAVPPVADTWFNASVDVFCVEAINRADMKAARLGSNLDR